ncbi:MAG TPA: tetratricopeptide repeat protein [Candidatus Binatia bacterium]|nr:tetratricopeptide repeat protein [Candidatus Binatia bacterium]
MRARFCPQCGIAAVAGARFCTACGSALDGSTVGPARGVGVTTAGVVTLAFFLVAGLTIWTLILSPAPPRPGPGAQASRAGAPAAPLATGAAGGELPPDHPKITLPEQAKTLLAQIAAKAKENPEDKDAWLRLAQAYYRAAQLDATYYPEAQDAFQHVIRLAPDDPDALRGLANIHYDRDEYPDAIAAYEKYLEQRPDDLSARTDLGTMYFYAGDATRALTIYRDVLRRDPKFVQAHVNLGVTLHQQGDDAGARTELTTARGLTTDDEVRRRIDTMLGGLGGGAPAPEPAAAAGPPPTPFQSAVEQAFRNHPIMGPKIVRFAWTGPATGRVEMRDFPMDAMPPAVREKFAAHLAEEIRTAQGKYGVTDPVKVDVADAASGTVMATVTP